MEKIFVHDQISFEVTAGVTIEEFNEKYNQLVYYLKDKYGYITDVNIRCHTYEYNNGENYEEVIDINYKRYETDEEFERRKLRDEFLKNEQKEREIKLMSQYIQSYKTEALEIINNLNPDKYEKDRRD